MIMDNGAAEGKMAGFGHVLSHARLMNVQEVVLPDVIKNMDRTLNVVAHAFYEAFEWRHRFRYMLVLQGKTVSECVQTAERAMNMYPGIIHSFGIPRHIIDTRPDARLRIVAQMMARELTASRSVHLLGTHPAFPGELLALGKEYNALGVRGVDTSLAWNATKQGVQLKDPKSLNYNLVIERQPIEDFAKGSFDHAAPRYLDLLRENMETMNSWVK